MRIPSASTDRKIAFVAVDSTDLKTRETGLSSFTVYRSRNGGTATAYTTPTVAELDATNMPGVYVLTLDEDTTLDSGHDTEEYVVHITQASMAPVTRAVELYRPKFTEGQAGTMANSCVDSDIERLQGSAIATPTVAGVLEVDVTHWIGTAAATPTVAGVPEVDLTHIGGVAVSTTTAQLGVNVVQISTDATAADNLETMLDGTGGQTLSLGALTVSGATTLTGNVAMANGLTVTRSSADSAAVSLTGNGTGRGLDILGGSSDAAGVRIRGGGTNGDGLTVYGVGSGNGCWLVAGTSSNGLAIVGGTSSGDAMSITTTSGHGINIAPAGTSKHGVLIAGGTGGTSDGLKLTAGTGGVGLRMDTATSSGTVTFNAFTVTSAMTVGTNAIPWNAAWDTEVQSEAEDALVVHRLDELLNADSDIDGAAPPTVGSVFHELMTSTTGSFTFDQTTDSLEALRDNTGTAGAGLTAIDLPDQTMNITGNITGNLTGTIGGLTAAALKDFFDTDSTTTYASAVAGSVVKEIADNAGGGTPPTVGEIADAVWDEAIAGHMGAGSTGAALNAAGSAGDPWTTPLPGAYGAGTAGYIIGNNLDAAVSSRLAPTTAGRTLDVTATGAAGVDWGNVENQSTAVNLSATNINVNQVVASVSGAVGSVTGNVGGNVVGSVASVTAAVTLPTIPTAWITADGIATDAIGALELAAGAASEIASAVRTELTTELARIDATISSRGTSTVTTAQVNAEVLDVLNVDTLVAGKTITQALKYIGATTAGVITDAGTDTETFRDFLGTTAVTITVDTTGNRSVIVYA